MKTFKKTILTDDVIKPSDTTLTKEHNDKIVLQQAINTIPTINATDILEALKQAYKDRRLAKTIGAINVNYGTIKAYKALIGWGSMTIQEQQKITDYILSDTGC